MNPQSVLLQIYSVFPFFPLIYVLSTFVLMLLIKGVLIIFPAHVLLRLAVFVLQDGVQSAQSETQREIQIAAHDIYESLVLGLLDTVRSESLSLGRHCLSDTKINQ